MEKEAYGLYEHVKTVKDLLSLYDEKRYYKGMEFEKWRDKKPKPSPIITTSTEQEEAGIFDKS